MKTTIVLTTNMSEGLATWLTEYSRKYQVTKRAIIEMALKKYRDDLKRKEMAESFQKASHDHELLALVEEGLEDYNKLLK